MRHRSIAVITRRCAVERGAVLLTIDLTLAAEHVRHFRPNPRLYNRLVAPRDRELLRVIPDQQIQQLRVTWSRLAEETQYINNLV